MSTDSQGILIAPLELKRLGKTSLALTTIEKFGGVQQGNAQQTTNLEALQENFDNGFSPNLEKTTVNIQDTGGNIVGTAVVDLPRGRELGGLLYTLSSGLRLLQQNPLDFVAKQTYPINAIVKQYQTNALYYSVIDNNTGADLSASLYSNATSYDIDVFVKSTEGHIYKSLATSNLNNPLTDNTKWQKVWHFIINYTRLEDINTYLTTFNTAEKLVKTDTNNKIISSLLNIASQNEVNTGTDSNKIVTPATLSGRPAFKVQMSANQTVASQVISKINFDTVVLDRGSYYNTTLKGYVPPAGLYYIGLGVYATANQLFDAFQYIYKNGVYENQAIQPTLLSNTASHLYVGALVECNGTDVITAHTNVSAGSGSGLITTSSIFFGYKVG